VAFIEIYDAHERDICYRYKLQIGITGIIALDTKTYKTKQKLKIF